MYIHSYSVGGRFEKRPYSAYYWRITGTLSAHYRNIISIRIRRP